MSSVRTKEEYAAAVAHLLDDAIHVPYSRMRFGADPVVGLIPVVGDALATVAGAFILIIARQLRVSWKNILLMALNMLKNGVIGAVPVVGDVYSFHFKSNVVNAALLIRAVKDNQDGMCTLICDPITVRDLVGLSAIVAPILGALCFVSFWFWDHNFSVLNLLYWSPYYNETPAVP